MEFFTIMYKNGENCKIYAVRPYKQEVGEKLGNKMAVSESREDRYRYCNLFSLTVNGNHYHGCCDYFTKWVEAYAILNPRGNKSSKSVY